MMPTYAVGVTHTKNEICQEICINSKTYITRCYIHGAPSTLIAGSHSTKASPRPLLTLRQARLAVRVRSIVYT